MEGGRVEGGKGERIRVFNDRQGLWERVQRVDGSGTSLGDPSSVVLRRRNKQFRGNITGLLLGKLHSRKSINLVVFLATRKEEPQEPQEPPTSFMSPRA